MPDHQLTWLITGSSSGFGYRFALLALQRGDRVLATARSLPKLQRLIDEVSAQDSATTASSNGVQESMKDRLKTLRLDLSDSEEVVKDVVKDAVGVWGGIDVLLNNAGWGQPSMIEEQGVKGIQHLLESNVMGTVKLTFAVLPYMRAQKSGTIVTIGSRSAWRAELPGIGSYAMYKSAIHAFIENLSSELAPFNIRALIVQPGSFRTEGIYSHGWNESNLIPDYDELRAKTRDRFASVPGKEHGDPWKAARAIVDIVRGEGIAKDRSWPQYLVLGDDAEFDVRNKCRVVLNALDEWKDITRGVGFDV
ncbi:NAD(P)-binding protein [Macrolepiota fuliginosa MF-IS2]|uniref:NAD(P)-binding protein n=1 Tax=Macrolepiota fuliginosa MF-IS2 TaxID=1400762 RepID=A0A9P5XDS3_9AGAR|nr:NAD(P)-binding protein [Macrolepiota fuliginosa MF-IS2]